MKDETQVSIKVREMLEVFSGKCRMLQPLLRWNQPIGQGIRIV